MRRAVDLMRMKFTDLNAQWREDALKCAFYRGMERTTFYVVWCDDCGEWMPPGTRAKTCEACRDARLGKCMNPECDKTAASSVAKYCCSHCKERHRYLRKLAHRDAVLRLRDQEGLAISKIAAELAISKTSVEKLLRGARSVGVST